MDKIEKIVGLAVFLVAALLFAGQRGYSQSMSKIGLVNAQKAFETSSEGKKAIAQILDREQKIRNEITRLDGQVQSLETKYNTQKLTLAGEAVIQLEAEISRKMTERKRYEEDATKDYQRFRAILFDKVKTEMVPILQALAKEKGLDVVLDMVESGVAYYNPAVDITDEVIRRYNASKAPVK